MIRMPTFFISHGAGPCFFMDWNPAMNGMHLPHICANYHKVYLLLQKRYLSYQPIGKHRYPPLPAKLNRI